MDPTPIYVPSPWGQEYHSLTTDEALGAGSAGPGKTVVLTFEALERIMLEHHRCQPDEHPELLPYGKNSPLYHGWGESKGECLHIRRTVKMLDQTIARTKRIFPKLDPGARWEEQKTLWTFSSGYKYRFGHCKDKDSWQEYLSWEFDLICFDELIQFEEEQYDQISMRLRSTDPALANMLKIRAMSNPVVVREGEQFSVSNPHWVRDRFVAPAKKGRTVIEYEYDVPHQGADGTVFFTKDVKTRIYLPATIDDNPDPVFRAQYKSRLASAKAHIRNAMLYGDWWATASSFFGEWWNPHLHTCRPFYPPLEWKFFRSLDWGFREPGCIHWWALDPDGTLFCIYELWFQGKTDREVASLVRGIETRFGFWRHDRSPLTGPADTQLWEARGEVVKSKADTFAELGVAWCKADKKSRERNAELLAARLKDHKRGTMRPGICFFDICKQAIEIIPAIQTARDPKGVALPWPMDGGNDHAYDSVAYATAYASVRGVGVQISSTYDSEEDEFDKRHRGAPQGQRQRLGYGV